MAHYSEGNDEEVISIRVVCEHHLNVDIYDLYDDQFVLNIYPIGFVICSGWITPGYALILTPQSSYTRQIQNYRLN